MMSEKLLDIMKIIKNMRYILIGFQTQNHWLQRS